ncbi:hypothetical protein [Glycomyces arizonensis]|uniref:hypothetical protein n=1 Tax=Glycomyces arizonensis TaxID=256035 RepID=UPI0012EC9A9E|nr:hypothetical protein [Glycomyces arizonensis]
MRSPYTLDNPPPDEPPSGVPVPSLWRVQARWWRRHTPALDQRSVRRPVCGHCGQAWPCHSWACWDGQLGEAVGLPGAAEPMSGATGPRPVPESRMSEPSPIRARGRQLAARQQRQKSAA